jgi:8-oxo-dGTP pyrophosphatase MutT (NUDIX family)
MAQKYKVYYNNRVIIITDNLDAMGSATIQRLCHYPEANLSEEWQRFKTDKEIEKFYIVGEPQATFKEFKKLFLIIKAAGGLVKNDKGEYLFIFRNGMWDLPKGKMDEGEKPRQTAIREVEEECGIEKLEITKPLKKSYHIYELKGRQALKKTYWFAMNCKDTNTPTPQKEEGIEKAIWVKPDVFKQWKKETYPSVWDIVKKVD